MIKSTAVVLAFGVGMTPAPTTVQEAPLMMAASGCCMHRKDEGTWRTQHRDFKQCIKENRDEGDKVMDKSGSVWWNPAC